MDSSILLIIGVIILTSTGIFMYVVGDSLLKIKKYQYMQLYILKKTLEKQGENIDLNKLYEETKRI